MQFPVVEDLGRITADDEFLDAIAVGGADLRSVFAVSGANAAGGVFPPFPGSVGARRPAGLGSLLVAWRSELLEPPLPALPTLAPRLMLAPADRSRRRSMRSLLSVGAAICALLMASTVVGAHSAQPGQPLWGLTQVLWSDHAHSIEAKVKVEAAIGFARKALKDGDAVKAQEVLNGLDGEVDKVLPADGRVALQHNLAKIQEEVGVVVGSDGPGNVDIANPPVAGRPNSSSEGGLIPPVALASSKARTTAPTAPSVSKPGAVSPPTTAAGSNVAAGGGGGGPTGNPPKSVTDLPIVPGVPATTSSPGAPTRPGTTSGPGPVIGPVTTADPTAPATTAGTTAPVDPTSPAPVETTAPATPAPDTTAGTTDAPTTPADPPTTSPATTDDPSTSDPEPSTTDDPTTATPTEETTPATSVSTTSEIPTTLESSPSTDSDGSTTGEPSSTTTQTAPVNSTGGSTSTEATDQSVDPGNDPASQSADSSGTSGAGNG